jgi:hypothetical protein
MMVRFEACRRVSHPSLLCSIGCSHEIFGHQSSDRREGPAAWRLLGQPVRSQHCSFTPPDFGDSYETLSLHNTTDTNHFPYLPFPDMYPEFLRADYLGVVEPFADL